MNLDEIKNIWKEDMNSLQNRVKLNEEKITQLEFDKAQSNFGKFLKISLAGKNMAMVYAIASLILMYFLRDSWAYVGILGIGAAVMIFSYIQHSVLKRIDYASLTIVELQKAIYNFRIHTKKTAVYDMSIVAIWMITVGLASLKWLKDYDVFTNPTQALLPGIVVVAIILAMVFASKYIYKDYDTKLKESEANLDAIKEFEAN